MGSRCKDDIFAVSTAVARVKACDGLDSMLQQQLSAKDFDVLLDVCPGFNLKETIIEFVHSMQSQINTGTDTSSKDNISSHTNAFDSMPFSSKQFLCDLTVRLTRSNWKELELGILKNLKGQIGNYIESIDEEVISCHNHLNHATLTKKVTEQKITDEKNRIKLLESKIAEMSKELQLVEQENIFMSSAIDAAKAATNNAHSQVELLRLNDITFNVDIASNTTKLLSKSMFNMSNETVLNTEDLQLISSHFNYNSNTCDEMKMEHSLVLRAMHQFLNYMPDDSHSWPYLLNSMRINNWKETDAKIGLVARTIGRINMLLLDMWIIEHKYDCKVTHASDITAKEFFLRVCVRNNGQSSVYLSFQYDLSNYKSLLCCLPVDINLFGGDNVPTSDTKSLILDVIDSDCNLFFINRCCDIISNRLSSAKVS